MVWVIVEFGELHAHKLSLAYWKCFIHRSLRRYVTDDFAMGNIDTSDTMQLTASKGMFPPHIPSSVSLTHAQDKNSDFRQAPWDQGRWRRFIPISILLTTCLRVFQCRLMGLLLQETCTLPCSLFICWRNHEPVSGGEYFYRSHFTPSEHVVARSDSMISKLVSIHIDGVDFSERQVWFRSCSVLTPVFWPG